MLCPRPYYWTQQFAEGFEIPIDIFIGIELMGCVKKVTCT